MLYKKNPQPLRLCKLEKIPNYFYRVTNRYSCQLHGKNDLGSQKKVPQTSFWCKECKISLCKNNLLSQILSEYFGSFYQ